MQHFVLTNLPIMEKKHKTIRKKRYKTIKTIIIKRYKNNLVQFSKTLEMRFQFKSLKIVQRMLRLRLLHSIFKASLLRHTLKTLTKLLLKSNRIYASYYVPKIFRNFFYRLRISRITFVTD